MIFIKVNHRCWGSNKTCNQSWDYKITKSLFSKLYMMLALNTYKPELIHTLNRSYTYIITICDKDHVIITYAINNIMTT